MCLNIIIENTSPAADNTLLFYVFIRVALFLRPLQVHVVFGKIERRRWIVELAKFNMPGANCAVSC